MSKLENVVVVSAKLGQGTSTKSGSPKPYQFANVTYLTQAKDFMNDNHAIQNCGYDTREINMPFNQELYNKFMNGCPFGQPVNLILGADPENVSRNIVVDFELRK